MRRIARLFAVIVFALAPGAGSAADIVVVVSARSSAPSLSPEQAANIFLGQAARFPDGAEAIALDQPAGSPLRDQFYLRVAGKSPALLKAYWSKMVFTGRGQPPRDAPDSTAVRTAVAENPSMIGYIDRDALDASVRPVLVLH
jgi:ABC-type phosphate transport system substrate-binding protein